MPGNNYTIFFSNLYLRKITRINLHYNTIHLQPE